MRIGFIRQRYVPSGGAERYLHAMASQLAGRGHDVHLFAHAWVGVDSDRVHFHRVSRISTTSFLRAISFALFCEKIVRRQRCDLVFSCERTLAQDVYRAGDGCHREWLAQRWRYASGWKQTLDLLNPLHRTLVELERRTFSPQHTGWVIANSHRGKDEIVRHYDFPEERIFVIHNGVDLQRYSVKTDDRARLDIDLLFVGTGFERKGLRFCIEALAKLPPQYKLKVVGKGKTSSYKRFASELGVEKRIEFLGFNLDLAEVYPSADLLVHPAIYEPFSNACLEAMACGVPVITSRINGVAEIIEHERNGAIVDKPDDIEGLVRAIQHFSDRSVRQAASRAARTVAEKHPFSEHVSQTIAVLQRAYAAKNPAGRLS